ncbi:ATP-binding protein [Parablautia muri]|uniref:FtsK domain-containing protein n=1 Tax=Parablautia muri TaxID=2320879 RepID=A0A9X5GTV6_9FIRM|nr:FtsK/SpoIIIE domain-containing protein [Parablautia muri]NBJ95453.1 hypothetical protein [Parablautia muri]
MIKQRILNLIKAYWRWVLSIVLYLIAVSGIWHYRSIVYHRYLQPFCEVLWGDRLLDMVLFAFLLTGFLCLILILRCPPIEQFRFEKAFKEMGIKNSNGEYPVLLSKRNDPYMKHGHIYKINSAGISTDTFDSHVVQIKSALALHVYRIDLTTKAKRILLYAKPLKYIKPTVISVDDTIFSRELCKLPNLLCIGKTGSGKSTALITLLGIYARYIPSVSLMVLDYKNNLFSHWGDTENFYGFESTIDGLRKFYQEFTERLVANDEERNKQIKVLLIDEYSSFLSAQDKRTSDEVKSMLANLLNMSRSLGLKIVIGMQAGYSEYFKAGAREQFHSILALGNISKEQKQMLFSEYKEQMNEQNKVGEGYLLIDGKGVEKVRIAKSDNKGSVINDIYEAMNR